VFGYDPAGRLTRVTDTSQGACVTRTYGFDTHSNRTSLASYPAAAGGACSTSTTPVTVASAFDQADRITTGGYSYDALGRTLSVPAGDATGIGAHASDTGTLNVDYYVNDLVRAQTQGAAARSYRLDPLQNRTAATVEASRTVTNHYTGDGESPAWTQDDAGHVSRYVPGPAGDLLAVIDQDGAVTLQLANLHGDIVATVTDDPAAGSVDTYTESTEYGLPRSAADALSPYGWLGAEQRSNDALGGAILMGVRLYLPTTGRFLSIDPIPGGNDNPYVYPTDPINAFDLDGQWGWPKWVKATVRVVVSAVKGGWRASAGKIFGVCMVYNYVRDLFKSRPGGLTGLRLGLSRAFGCTVIGWLR
jgi:RHS repeat-associated protein